MATMTSLVEHYKWKAEIHQNHTVHISKLRRVEKREEWKHVEKIGWGSSGFVWLQEKMGEVAGQREQRAVKVLEKGRMKQMNIDYMKELEALTEFRTQKIRNEEVLVNFYGWFEDKDTVFLAMEYFPLGDLESHISIDSITERDAKDITVDLLKAIELMHAEGFTHRDIKPQNIFVLQNSPKWFVKLGDFGISKRTSSATTALRTNTGTPLYSAPEIGFDGKDEDGVYTKAVDLWSVGCVVYHILAQRAPFETTQAKKKPFPIGHIVRRVSADGIDFISKLLVLEPARRLAAAEALAHPWLVDVHPDESTSGQKSQSDVSTQTSLQSWEEQNSDGVLTRLSTDIESHRDTAKLHGSKSQSDILTQMSLQPCGEQYIDGVLTRLSAGIISHSGTEEGHVIDKTRSQSRLRPGGNNGLLLGWQKHPWSLIAQPEEYRRRTQHIMDRTKAEPDVARDEHPPSSASGTAKHSPEGQQRSTSSIYETPPETLGIKTKPSVVVNAAETLLNPRAVVPSTPLYSPLASTTALKAINTATPPRIVLGKDLREASERGDIDSVRDIVRCGGDVESIEPREGSRRTAIHYASSSGHTDIVEFLLDGGAKIDARDAGNATPLHSAASEGHSGTVRLLLYRGALVDSKQQDGSTPLHEAAENGHVSVTRKLLEKGADINMRTSQGWTALHIAAQNNHKDVVSLLLAANADINMQPLKGGTALHVAAQCNHKDIVSLLLAANADGNMEDSEGWTALHIAATKNHKDIVSLLLAAGAHLRPNSENGATALHFAALAGHVETVELLLQAATNLWAKDRRGQTALDDAMSEGHEEVVKLFAVTPGI